ncbi:MAG: short-chain fatty acyl-CoA regulator family protein [Pseudomonadota bacterium]
MSSAIVGTRIRQHRRDLGESQSNLAKLAGISPSYLNLIEWNKRAVSIDLLKRIAAGLGVTAETLDGSTERGLHETLLEISQLQAVDSAGVETGRTAELIGRFPGWSRGIAALAQAERQASRRAQTLSERLSNDPFLNEAVHRMLTRIAAVRSAADILIEYDDLTAQERKRFTAIAAEESAILSETGEALANYLDKAEEGDRVLTPVDEVEAFFEQRKNRFGELEQASAGLEITFTDSRPAARVEQARDLVNSRLQDTIEDLLRSENVLESAAAQKRARSLLTDYAIGALLMPAATFADQARNAGYDVEALADTFSVGVERVCHRLTALPAGEDVPRFGYVQANAAGTIVEMLRLDGLRLPRYAAACPLWALYRAQQSPETVIRQRAVFPQGGRIVFVARARHVGLSGFGKPRHYVTDMIAMTEADARLTVYAPDSAAPVEEVGPSCRLCPRVNCAHRVEDPLT